MLTTTMTERYPAAHLIKEIGRGIKGARSLSQFDAHALFAAILAGRVADLELGALLMALRIKGEDPAELAGFLQAVEQSFPLLQAPESDFAPIVIPSYNGARRVANLTPLLALLLAREGAPVLVHGVIHEYGRVTSAEIFQALGLSNGRQTLEHQLEESVVLGRPVVSDINQLAPRLGQVLALRQQMGVRNSAHTLVKIIQPFAQPALRLSSYTHPEYLTTLSTYFMSFADDQRGDVFLMRGCEGETVANTKKVQQIDWFHSGQNTRLVEAQVATDEVLQVPLDAEGTATWIAAVLAGREPIPANIAEQVRHCLHIAKQIKQRTAR